MSDQQESRGIPGWAWLVAGAFLVLIVVNLGMTVFARSLPAALTADRMEALAFWGGWSTAAASCVAGWWWAGKALSRSDRDSTRRLRTCFLLALCGVVMLALATFEGSLERPQFAAVVAAVMAFVVTPFAVSARALADGGHRRRRRRSREDT